MGGIDGLAGARKVVTYYFEVLLLLSKIENLLDVSWPKTGQTDLLVKNTSVLRTRVHVW